MYTTPSAAFSGYPSPPPPPPPPPPPVYQPYQPYPYAYPGQYPPPWVPRSRATNGMAIASMVLGILWLWGVGSILAVIFGHVALSQVRRRNENGRGMAIAGVVLGWVGLAGMVLFIVVVAVTASNTSGSDFGSSTVAVRAVLGVR